MQIEILEIQTPDLDRMREFYGGRLGLPLTSDSEGTLSVTVGNSRLILRELAGFTGRYHFAFNIPENRLDAAKGFLESLDISLLPDENGDKIFNFESWNAHSVYFFDPAGNILELIARHQLDNPAPNDRPLSASDLLLISEVGLPTTDVEALSSQLCEAFGISPYREVSPTFAALGDANGLFIVVPEGRIWFPNTGLAAESLPVRVVVRTGEGQVRKVTGMPYAFAS